MPLGHQSPNWDGGLLLTFRGSFTHTPPTQAVLLFCMVKHNRLPTVINHWARRGPLSRDTCTHRRSQLVARLHLWTSPNVFSLLPRCFHYMMLYRTKSGQSASCSDSASARYLSQRLTYTPDGTKLLDADGEGCQTWSFKLSTICLITFTVSRALSLSLSWLHYRCWTQAVRAQNSPSLSLFPSWLHLPHQR